MLLNHNYVTTYKIRCFLYHKNNDGNFIEIHLNKPQLVYPNLKIIRSIMERKK